MTTILYGECIGPRESTMVRISGLADQGCDLETDRVAAVAEGEVSLWIGAIGPFTATARRKDASHLALRFKEPLDERILEHFGQ
ncbi:hypothetical protein [Novosphingobium malaysiense]|uniref:PilZ domain-containing protein n=1 Tax=Novosphingobium malaysiense TaxID=1348853 RepID=A0A0B1ZL14_9SPHN|nr:hypothetical protein [Novosphingobium malaysiense]KHK90014.1 hypothetical protein LK12_19215 [Novosphingobium malaysiense]